MIEIVRSSVLPAAYAVSVRQRREERKPLLVTKPERADLDAGQLSPFGKRSGRSVVRHQYRSATSSTLLDPRSPSTVRRLVVAIGVDSVQAVFLRRSRRHVGDERFEALAPTIAHADAPGAVVRIALVLRVVAARLGRSPRSILRRLPALASAAVCQLAPVLGLQATAAFRLSSEQSVRSGLSSSSARTAAQPDARAGNGNEFYGRQSAELHSGEVVAASHGAINFSTVFVGVFA